MKRAIGLQLIQISGNQVVLKRGIHELLISGEGVSPLLERILQMVDTSRTEEEITDEFPGHLRGDIKQLLSILRNRRMIDDTLAYDANVKMKETDELQSAFYLNFGSTVLETVAKLRKKEVVIFGANLISRALVRNLLEMEIGRVTIIDHPILSNNRLPHDSLQNLTHDREKLRLVHEDLPDMELAEASLICATSDFGEADALLDINRLALTTNIPYLPVWLAEMVGFVGPLLYPFETACLRCYRLRADSNDPKYPISSIVRMHVTNNLEARPGTGMLPPMTGVLGDIAAMEIVKLLAEFAPSNTMGHLIEINLVSFRSSVRRVLKVPRCPDCSDIMQRSSRVLMHGPQASHPAMVRHERSDANS